MLINFQFAQAQKTRTESDLLGKKEIPFDAYYGVQTMRALENFQVSGVKTNFYPDYVRAYAMVKLAAARANADVGRLKKEKLDAIEKACPAVINKYPDRFLMGTDEVAPNDQASYLKILDMYKPLFDKLTPEAKQKLMKGNYERLFDAARKKVREWERIHANDPAKTPAPTPSSGIDKN